MFLEMLSTGYIVKFFIMLLCGVEFAESRLFAVTLGYLFLFIIVLNDASS